MRLFYYFYSIRKDISLTIGLLTFFIIGWLVDTKLIEVHLLKYYIVFLAGFIFAQNYRKVFRYFFNMYHYRLRTIKFKDDVTIQVGNMQAYESIHSTNNTERIISVAIRTKSGLIFSIDQPYRHLDLLNKMEAAYFERRGDQGFITSRGRFTDRFESRHIASLAGQLKGKQHGDRVLMSEDIW